VKVLVDVDVDVVELIMTVEVFPDCAVVVVVANTHKSEINTKRRIDE